MINQDTAVLMSPMAFSKRAGPLVLCQPNTAHRFPAHRISVSGIMVSDDDMAGLDSGQHVWTIVTGAERNVATLLH